MSDTYTDRMNAFHDAHRGAMQAFIVRPEHMPFMFQAALAGDADRRVILQSLEQWIQQAGRRKKHERFLCLDCDTNFHQRRMPDAFLVVTPFATASEYAMVVGICRRCADRDDAALSTAALNNLRTIYPDATFAKIGQA